MERVAQVRFSLIQFPLWEAMKLRAAVYEGREECSALAGAACGSVAGEGANQRKSLNNTNQAVFLLL